MCLCSMLYVIVLLGIHMCATWFKVHNSTSYCNPVVKHLKTGKPDGSEGLSSVHFIHGNRKLYVLLSILFT